MENHKELNLLDQAIIFCHPHNGVARIAVNYLSAGRLNLATLLRHHDRQQIEDEETYYRDGFDLLLEFYSLVEVGVRAGVFPNPLPTTFTQVALYHLGNDDVQKYYSKNYPLLLPQLLLARLNGHPVADVAIDAPASFSKYMDLRKMLNKDDRVWRSQMTASLLQASSSEGSEEFYKSLLEPNVGEKGTWANSRGIEYLRTLDPRMRAAYDTPEGEISAFLSLVDGYQFDAGAGQWISIVDVVKILGKASSFVSHIQRAPEDPTPLDDALWGLLKFIDWCRAYYRFLEALRSDDMEQERHLAYLRSAYWHANSYWFATLQEWEDTKYELVSRIFDGIRALRVAGGDTNIEAAWSAKQVTDEIEPLIGYDESPSETNSYGEPLLRAWLKSSLKTDSVTKVPKKKPAGTKRTRKQIKQ